MNRQSAAKSDIILKPFPISLNGFENKYKVSSDGRIWSEYLQDFLKPYFSKGGYLRVKVNFGDRNKKFMVHRLVALSFIENKNPELYTQVDHIDCNRTNNNVHNLRWVTPKRNTQHAILLGNRDWYKYKFINSETGEILEFNTAAKACKYFGGSYQVGTIVKYANSGNIVKSGRFTGWIIERINVRKVQRPSSAEEQGKVTRNGNSPTDDIKSRALIWSNLYGNIEQSLYKPAQRRAEELRTLLNINGSNFCRLVRAGISRKYSLLYYTYLRVV